MQGLSPNFKRTRNQLPVCHSTFHKWYGGASSIELQSEQTWIGSSSAMVNHEEEYTDYSCSTAIERLSRDVETILRTWHVDKGSDRHVSVRKPGQKSSLSASSYSFFVDDPNSSLIRSNSIPWTITLTTVDGGRSSVTVDLELALWDSPEGVVVNDPSETEQNGHKEKSSTLVRSLRRVPFTMPTHDLWFDNFSALFGIGQHISLTPIQPNPIPKLVVDSLGESVLQRHDDQTTAPWVIGSALSGWLQMALNIAVANCHCCIPAFGLWGVYRPNQLNPTSAVVALGNKLATANIMRRDSRASSSASSMLTSSQASNKDGLDNAIPSPTSAEDALLGKTIQTKSNPVLTTGIQIFPQWTQAIRSTTLPTVGRRYKARAQANFWNQQFIPPFVCGSVICPGAPIQDPAVAGTMWISVSRSTFGMNNRIASRARLAVWGSVLLQHCPNDSTVVLVGARHIYGWFKPPKPTSRPTLFGNVDRAVSVNSLQEWRQTRDVIDLTDDFAAYRKACQAHALDLLEDAWGCKEKNNPMWGPLDDPVASVYATASWSGKIGEDGVMEPLLSFPLRIRSRRKLSKRDWIDMEESVERSILDPVSSSSRFYVQAFFDRGTSVATLAANQRCVLAALIRSATLPGETLLQHLTDEDLVGLWDDNAGTIVASKLAERSKVGHGTRQIVEVMDWSSIMEEMISVREAEEVVHDVMNGALTAAFPSSPEESFIENDLLAPFQRAAPYGRLLCVLFAHMARLRALSSIALVWDVFVQELRRRWETRESLPNMQYVAGLDPHPLELYKKRCFSSIGHKANFSAFLNCSEPDPDDYHCLIGQKLQVFNIGIECIVAGEILEHEVMERFLEGGEVPVTAKLPDMERSSSASEGQSHDDSVEGEEAVPMGRIETPKPEPTKKKWPKAKDKVVKEEEKTNYGPPAINSDLEFWVMDEPGFTPRDEGIDFVNEEFLDDTGFDFVAPPPAELDDTDLDSSVGCIASRSKMPRRLSSVILEGLPEQNGAWEGTIMEDDGSGGSAVSRTTTCSVSQAYYDAAEAGSIFSLKHGFVSLDTVVNVADMRRRPGARCPVQGVALRTTGDQLYAPYLQRPQPLTEDLILERRHMLARQIREGEKKRGALQFRLELAQRLQKPKLLSDMSAFKAANPSASMDDFTRWYGNPGNPLEQCDDDLLLDDDPPHNSVYQSAAAMLDKASEAMKVLTSTRDFWSSTWEEAKPAPAAEQLPLFDFSTAVEMVIDYLEQMHPANLLNQVMAVNLSSAYFTLVSSVGDALKIGLVKSSVQILRTKIERALNCLSDDATGALFQNSDNGSCTTSTSNHYISEESIFACEQACNALSVAETVMARGTSLLKKLPGQYNLVHQLLSLADGTNVALADQDGRRTFLNAVHSQQKQHAGFNYLDSIPRPVLREYVLRNLDDGKPCQLSVRFGDEGAYLDRVENEGGVLLALLKSYSD